MSQDFENDRLILQLALARFPDKNQARIPEIVNKIKEIPRQIGSRDEAEVMNTALTATQSAVIGASALNFVLSWVLGASLKQLWSMVNSL